MFEREGRACPVRQGKGNTMAFDELMAETGRKLGVDLVTYDGLTQLMIDDMEISISEIAERESVVLSGSLGEPPPQGLAPLYRAMLEANYGFAGTAGATLAVNPENGELTLTRLAPLALLDAEGFLALLEGFANVLEAWRKLVADYRPNAADFAASSLSDGMPQMGGNFLPV